MKLHEDALAPEISPAQPEQAISGDHESSEAANKAVDPPKKITVLLSKHPSNANLLAAEEIRSLRRLGYEIALSALESTLRDSEDYSPEIRAEAEATHYVRTPGTLRRLTCHLRAIFNPLPYFRLIYHAVRLDGWSGLMENRHVADVLDLSCWMRRQGIHHLHAHFGTEAARVSVLMKYFRGATLSLTLGNPDDLHHAGPARLKQKVEAADFIICVGTATKNALMRLTHSHHWHKYDVCELGVDTLRYQPKSQKFKSGVFTVLCVGQLEPRNGQRTLLEACRLLKESGRMVRLVLVGSGDDEPELRARTNSALMDDAVTFIGAQNQKLVSYWHGRADAFVNSSLAEGMSLPVMEAMASGLACVSSRTNGMLELMREGSEGLLVEPDNAPELAGAILRLMDDDALRTRLAGYGRARILQKYSLSRTSERFGNLFQTRLSTRQGHRRKSVMANSHPMKFDLLSDPSD